MKSALIILAALTLQACAPSVADVNAIYTQAALTIAAQATATPAASSTPPPTNTPMPSATVYATATTDRAAVLESIRQQTADLVAGVEGVESVSMVRFAGSTLEIELKTVWASQSRQADVSYEVIQKVGLVYGLVDKGKIERSLGGPFTIRLTTYSTDGKYRYVSQSDWDTLHALATFALSYDEWVARAQAGFQ